MLPYEAEMEFSIVPLLTSLVVALGGLYLGWLAYRNVKAGQEDPLKGTLGSIHTVLQNKFYMDEFYEKVFIKPAVWVSEVFTSIWMDKKVIDGFLHAIANFFLGLGKLVRKYFDVWVINEGGDALADGVLKTGGALTSIQTGRVQQYLATSIASITVIGALVYVILVVLK